MRNPPKDEVLMTRQPGVMEKVRSSLCFQSLLGFFFNKGVRGGPKILLNLAGVLVALIVFVKLLPSRMTEGALQAIAIPKNAWPGKGTSQQSSDIAGLRIVVFGELDVGTPVGLSQEADSKTWTEALCDQLACETHISMVPPPDTAPWSVSSTEIYAQGVEKVLNETAFSEGPGRDYSFVASSYPPQWDSWDLKTQIDGFLAMPKGPTPVSTLWVLSFGQWDVWALSALPIGKGREAVDGMTRDIFAQVERLYTASMDPNSVAYSNINTLKPAAAENINATELPEQAHPEAEYEVKNLAGEIVGRDESTTTQEDPAANAPPTEEAPPQATNTFQILLVPAVDPSLLPGWRDLRPQLPSVHSKAEQLRNAVALTAEWNGRISDRLIEWIHQDDEPDAKASDDVKSSFVASTGPTRDGFAFNMANWVTDRITDRQLRNAHLSDGAGLGAGAIDAGFRDVRNPCLQPVETAQLASSGVAAATASGGEVRLNIANVKLEGDLQAPTANTAMKTKRAEYVEVPGVAYVSAGRECEIPGDHLFYTPFALSQKAILEVAGETAEVIRRGETVRKAVSSFNPVKKGH